MVEDLRIWECFVVHEEELVEINVQILWDGRTASEIFGWHLVSRIEILDLGYSNIYKAFFKN